jgi:pimeloyl-ACP methyl ester carboxylesterase
MNLVLKAVAAALRALSRVSTRLAGRVAYALFGRAIRAKMRDAERDVHLRARTKTVTVNGRNVAVYWWGDGASPVLLIHGWGGRASNYAGFVPRLLDRGMTAIAFDMPGHGESEGKSTDLLECAEIIRCIQEQHGAFHAIVAHSFGSLSAFQAVRGGVTTGRLVSISGVCDIGYPFDNFCRTLGLDDGVRQDLRRRAELHFAPEQDIWLRFCASYDPAAFDLPILVIHDENDETVDPEQGRRLAEAHAPRATLVTTTGLGHRKIMATPNVIDSVVDFVAAGAAEPRR